MTALRIKIVVFIVWAAAAGFLFSARSFSTASGQVNTSQADVKWRGAALKPADSLIDAFDASIQKRFLTKPNFGIRRIQPVYPVNPHLEQFSPDTDEENRSLADFERGGWNVYLLLFGKWTTKPGADSKRKENFIVDYRINQPVHITWRDRERNRAQVLPKGETVLKEVKAAFLAFQEPGGEDSYEFRENGWSYVARPVRAVNESCVKCHTDYVMTGRLAGGKYKFRKRRIGDVNGVLVYGFRRKD